MKIEPTISRSFNSGGRDPGDFVGQLRLGQVLQAHVIDSPGTGVARLQVGLTQLLAKTQVALEPGAQLTLSVSRLGNPPELQVLRVPVPVSPELYMLRRALPHQVGIAEVLNAIEQRLAQDGAKLPQDIQEQVAGLLNRAVDPQLMSATRLKEQFLNSGLFFEALLARYGHAVRGDMKLELLLLLRRMRALAASSQPEGSQSDPTHESRTQAQSITNETRTQLVEHLIQLLNRALARIHTQQAISLAPDLRERPVWQFDLPLAIDGQPLQVLLRLEHEIEPDNEPRNRRHKARWRATLRFEFASTGWIQANLHLCENHVSSTFWCEHASTQQRIDTEFPRLRRAMEGAGLQVDKLVTRHGAPPNAPGLPNPQDALIDDHA